MSADARSVSPSPDEVRAQLERILGSPSFSTAHRSQRFLRYIVERSLDPAAEPVKEYTIAVDVFDRDASYDPSVDATVRVEAGRLRGRLREYYGGEGRRDPLIIEVPKGGYRPSVTWRPHAEEPAAEGVSPAMPDSAPAISSQLAVASGPRMRRAYWPIATAGLLVLTGALALLAYLKTEQRPATTSAPIAMAVLPFTNQTGTAADSALAEGLTENLIRQCSEIPRLRVMTRSAVENVTPETAAAQLGITILLTGRLRKDKEGHLLVDGELSDARSGSVIRSREYATEQDDLQAAQADIVQDLIDGLGIGIDSRRQAEAQRPITTSAAAFDDFLRGEAAHRTVSPEATHDAIADYQEAVRKDPAFALAWAGMAEAHVYLGLYFEPPAQQMEIARADARHALAIDNALQTAHGTLGMVELFYDWDYAGARKELASARARQAAITRLGCTAHLLGQSGQVRQAEQDLHEMLEFDPRSASLLDELGCVHYYAGDYEDAIRDFRRGLATDPHSPLSYWGLGKALTREGRYREALDVLRRFKAESGFEPPLLTAEIGYTLGVSNDHAGALASVRVLEEESKQIWVDPYLIALVYHSIGDEANTYGWLDRAYGARSPFLISLPTEPKWNDARDNPRFRALLERMLRMGASHRSAALMLPSIR